MTAYVINFIVEVVCMYILMFPIFREVADDKDGDFDKKKDVRRRIANVFGAASAVCLIKAVVRWIDDYPKFSIAPIDIVGPVLLSSALFFLIFDYAHNLSRKRTDWLSYTGKNGWFDNWKPWKSIAATTKLVIKLIAFIIAVFIYSIPKHLQTWQE